jgi:membrane-anchored protein YejM (alkaline phosphatase superfamily)
MPALCSRSYSRKETSTVLFDFTTLEITLVLLKQGRPGQGDKSETVPGFVAFLLAFDFSTWTAKRLKHTVTCRKILRRVFAILRQS